MIHWIIALSLAISLPVPTGKYHGESSGNGGQITISATNIWGDPAPAPPPVYQPSSPPKQIYHKKKKPKRPGWSSSKPKPRPKPIQPTAPSAPGGSATEMATVQITPSVITMWPASGDVLINLRTPVMTDDEPQLYTVNLHGEEINVRATPIEFTWDFGDGTVFTTTDPGTPFPNASISHQYLTRSPKTRITLETTWEAEFQHPTTGEWYPVDGVVTTTSQSRWFARKMAQSFLTDEAERLQGH